MQGARATPVVAAASAAQASSGVPVIIAAIAVAWGLAIVAQATGTARLLHHDTLIEGGVPPALAVGFFVLAWQAMIAAMMLPSSLPLVRMFSAVVAAQPQPRRLMAAFLGGYAAVWTLFGLAAFVGDIALHRAVDSWGWLAAHPWFVSAAVLAAAGAFQFSPLKDACLSKCRLPATFLLRNYRRGAASAFDLGRRHGLFCVGCCWALMLVSFAAGFAALWWMAALTALMVVEKTARNGRALVPIAGAALLAYAAVVAWHPAWLRG